MAEYSLYHPLLSADFSYPYKYSRTFYTLSGSEESSWNCQLIAHTSHIYSYLKFKNLWNVPLRTINRLGLNPTVKNGENMPHNASHNAKPSISYEAELLYDFRHSWLCTTLLALNLVTGSPSLINRAIQYKKKSRRILRISTEICHHHSKGGTLNDSKSIPWMNKSFLNWRWGNGGAAYSIFTLTETTLVIILVEYNDLQLLRRTLSKLTWKKLWLHFSSFRE